MKVSKKQKIYAAVLGVGLCAFGADRLFSGPDAALASPEFPKMPHAKLAALPAAADETLSATANVADHLQAYADEQHLSLSSVNNAFKPGTAWAGPTSKDKQNVEDRPKVDEAALKAQAFKENHKLMAVVVSQHGGAVVNGRLLRVGQAIDGFRLLSVTKHSAQFKAGSVKVELALPVADLSAIND